ncbi:MAG: hypothetical protein ABW088_13805 [Sedimenticola sp.]
MESKVMPLIAVITISILAIASCAIGVAGIYALVQIPDRHINFYLVPLFIVPGILLLNSLSLCLKKSGSKELGFKLGKTGLIAIPTIYYLACLDSGIISGLEFAGSLPILAVCGLCFWLLKAISKVSKPDNKALNPTPKSGAS